GVGTGLPADLKDMPLSRFEPGKRLEAAAISHEDNSLTQFAVLALWAARKYDVPVERCLALVDARMRTYQNQDGSWGYTVGSTGRRDSMTCAGLLGLAVYRGLGKGGVQGEVKDEAIEKGLVYLGHIVGRPGVGKQDPQEEAKAQAELQNLQQQ